MSVWSKLKFTAGPVAAGLLIATVLWAPLERIDTIWSDFLFRRMPRQVAVDDRIVIIGVDEKSLDNIKAPTAFWTPYFAQVFAGLYRNRAKVIGLDFLIVEQEDLRVYSVLNQFYPGMLGPDAVEGHSTWIPVAVARQDMEEDPIKTVFVEGFLCRTREDAIKSAVMSRSLQSAVGTDVLALLTADIDVDQVWRHQYIFPRHVSKENRVHLRDDSYKTFGGRIAEGACQRTLEKEGDSVKNRPVVLDRQSHVKINFLPPAQSERFPIYSFCDVLAKAGDKEYMKRFEGKVVLVGTVAAEMQDIASTSVGQIPGLECQAMLVNTLLTENYIFECSYVQCFLGLAVVCCLSAAVAQVGTFGVSLVLQSLSTALVVGASALVFQRFNFLLPVWFWSLGGGVSWLMAAAIRARGRAKELAHVRQLFGRYVSPQVMETILKDSKQATLGAVGKRKITVLFTDINGFSSECERRTAAEVMDMLNAYFQEMNEIIFRYDGTIKQFVGDEIMAMYGAPAPHPHPEVAAVQTVVSMLRRLRELHQRDPGRKRGFYDIKIGIHAGPVILGNVGSASRTEYAAVGDDVNLGSRIMGMCKSLEAKVLVSREIYEKSSHLAEVRFHPKGSHAIKGRKELVELFEMEVVGLETDGIQSIDTE